MKTNHAIINIVHKLVRTSSNQYDYWWNLTLVILFSLWSFPTSEKYPEFLLEFSEPVTVFLTFDLSRIEAWNMARWLRQHDYSISAQENNFCSKLNFPLAFIVMSGSLHYLISLKNVHIFQNFMQGVPPNKKSYPKNRNVTNKATLQVITNKLILNGPAYSLSHVISLVYQSPLCLRSKPNQNMSRVLKGPMDLAL